MPASTPALLRSRWTLLALLAALGLLLPGCPGEPADDDDVADDDDSAANECDSGHLIEGDIELDPSLEDPTIVSTGGVFLFDPAIVSPGDMPAGPLIGEGIVDPVTTFPGVWSACAPEGTWTAITIMETNDSIFCTEGDYYGAATIEVLPGGGDVGAIVLTSALEEDCSGH